MRSINEFPKERELNILSKGVMLASYLHPIVRQSKILKVDRLENPQIISKTIATGASGDPAWGTQQKLLEMVRDLEFLAVHTLYQNAIKTSEEEQVLNHCLLKMMSGDLKPVFNKLTEIYTDIYPELSPEDDIEVQLGEHILQQGYRDVPISGMHTLKDPLIPDFIMWVDNPPIHIYVEDDIKIKKGKSMIMTYQIEVTKKPIMILERSKNESNI